MPQPDSVLAKVLEASSAVFRNIDVDKIRGPRHPLRPTIDPENLGGLKKTLSAHGQLQPVCVQLSLEAPDEYELLSGERRLMAVRQLREEAATPEERHRFSVILARVVPHVDDSVALLWGMVENKHRVELNFIEFGEGLETYLGLSGRSPEEAAADVGLSHKQVERLLRISKAPLIIKEACTTGLQYDDSQDHPDATEEHREERASRRLDLYAALAFQHAYDLLVKSSGEDEARKALWPSIRKALEDKWSVRRVEQECAKLTGGDGAHKGGRSKEHHRSHRHAPQEARGDAEPAPADAPVVAPDPVASAPADATPTQTRDSAPAPTPTADGAPAPAPGGAPDQAVAGTAPVEQARDASSPSVAPAPVQADMAPTPADTPPAKARSPYQNPGWDYVSDEEDCDVIFHPSRFKDLTPGQRQGTHFLLDDLKVKLGPVR